MALDLYRTDEAFVATIDLPGVSPASIDVDVDGRVLTVRAERPRPEGDVRWLVRGRPAGTFARRFTLGETVDAERISAAYADGVLTLTVPVAEQSRPRKVEVTTAQVSSAVEQDSMEQAA
ncbi:Hsp20/alpha crystallin family protein [Pseudactinotalea suaedae]|uniref:Hsp20/alpha crystallin family protein n=1 Tax=Pseudactinotalea suaedae TaxID=1524924 RepID=UPI0012E2CC45|nr:Hsp20/alpha crystallin family protein [Pseudactinotalea suaedae]